MAIGPMTQTPFLDLIKATLEFRMESLFSKKGTFTFEPVSFDAVKVELDSITTGNILRAYGKTDTPKLLVYITDTKSDQKIIRNLFATLGLFLFWEEGSDLAGLWAKMGMNLVNLFQCNEIHSFNDFSRKEFFYQIANFKIVKVKWNEQSYVIGFSAELFDSINKSIKDGGEISKFVESIKQGYAKNQPQKKIFPKLQIERPREFEIGKFLVPKSLNWGNIPIKTRLNFIRETHAKDAQDVAFWFGLSLTFEEKSYYLQYAFPHQKLEKPEEIQLKYQSLLGNILKPLLATRWNTLSKPLQKSGSKLLEHPILPMFEKGIIVEYEIRVNQSTLICHVIVPKNLVDLIDSTETGDNSFESAEPLLHFINVNRKLIYKKYAETFQVYFHQTENRKYPILLFEFLNIIKPSDLTLTIQNFFVASGIKTIDLQRFFFYLKSDASSQTKLLFLDEDFDEARVKSLLPPGMQKEWEMFPVIWENRTGLSSISLNFDEFLQKNREVMQALFDHSQNGKIDFSPQTRYILYSEFAKLIKEELQEKLKAINTSSIGLFAKLKDVPKANVQQFFYSLKSDELGCIFLDWESELPKIQAFVSKKFYQEASEDLAAKKQALLKSSLDLNVVLTLKRKFAEELTTLTSEEFV
jgi:hypothetical protein